MGIWDNLTGIFTGKPLENAAKAREAGIRQGLSESADIFGQSRGVLEDYYTRAIAPFSGLQGTANRGYDAYADASGANGPEGLARARANFSQSPGFDFAMTQGVDAINRSGVARGGATGNVLREAQTFGSGLAQQDWGNYVQRLAPWLSEGRGVASAMSGAAGQFGPQIASTLTSQADQTADAYGRIGEAKAGGELASLYGGQNIWGLGLNLAKLAAGGLPGFGGGGAKV